MRFHVFELTPLYFKQGVPFYFGFDQGMVVLLPTCTSGLRKVASSAGHFFCECGRQRASFLFFYFLFFSPEVIFCCLFWQVISEEGSVREIAGIILASSNSYLPPPTLPQQSHLLSLLFLFLNILSLISFVAACCCCCYCLFVSFCGPFGYDFSSINLVLF